MTHKKVIFNLTSILLTAVLFLLAVSLFSVLPLNAAGERDGGRYIVTFDEVNGASRAALEAHGHVVKQLELVNGFVVILPDRAAVEAVGALSGVNSLEKDVRVYAQKPPSGCEPWPDCKNGGGETPPPPQPSQVIGWGVDRIDADLAWGTSRGAGVKVAIIDTGIDKDHADLVQNIKGGVNFVVGKGPAWKPADPSKWDDDNGHGTHVAGIVAAADNSIGVVGVAPEAYLYAVKVLNSKGSGYLSDVVAGIDWAVANGMQVINMSLGCDCDSAALKDAVDAADAAGIVVVAAAGNSGDGNGATNDVIYPAKYASVIAVSATASDDSTPSWSSEGSEVEIAAPGVSINSTTNDGAYGVKSGTSMASPHVAGVAALVLGTGLSDSNGNGLVNDEVRALLGATADDLGALGKDPFYGYGLVDAEESVTGVQTNP